MSAAEEAMVSIFHSRRRTFVVLLQFQLALQYYVPLRTGEMQLGVIISSQ